MENKYKQKTIFIIAVIVLCIGTSITACKNISTMKKYEWRPTANAPKYYPAEIVNGYFYMKDSSTIYIPKGHNLMQGWGTTGAAHVVGEDRKPVPYKFDITWVSYLEEKFYGGTFELPTEKMEKLFEEGYINHLGKKETYSSIVLGLAPGGVVVVWLLEGGSTVEVARYQAKEVTVTEEEFIPYADMSVEEYVSWKKQYLIEKDIKDAIDVTKIPFGKWDVYRKKYVWTPKVTFKSVAPTEIDFYGFGIDFYNGEEFFLHPTNQVATSNIARAIPEAMYLKWKKAGYAYGAKVFFNEAEIFEVFNEIYTVDKQAESELQIQIDKYYSTIDLCFVANQKKYVIKNARIKLYEASSN